MDSSKDEWLLSQQLSLELSLPLPTTLVLVSDLQLTIEGSEKLFAELEMVQPRTGPEVWL